ncbi:uncharacterized protein LOC107369049 [Tetranychus urticae]|uniref:uncharacterized protein LOC107369049 n=1 Tax=Tetranychus urticae TaxID=32264 RepID=UPI00077B9301|nr:uncharacterized protein LOC107369049 [Tetranychus urticae]
MQPKMNLILIKCFILIYLQNQFLANPVTLEDGVLLRQIADSYSAPLVASFLHSRIENTAEMVEDIKNSLENLSENQRNLFILKVKSLEALNKQLTSLQKTDYFNFNGTERVKYLIEQYILNNEMFPTELGFEETKFNSTPDDLLKQLNVMSNDNLIKDTNDLINVYLKDIEEKESNEKYNGLQRFAASLTKHKLKTLVNFKFSEPEIRRDDYGERIGTTDNRASQIESVLRQCKSIVDLFYHQFESIATQSAPSSSLEPVTPEVKARVEVKHPL